MRGPLLIIIICTAWSIQGESDYSSTDTPGSIGKTTEDDWIWDYTEIIIPNRNEENGTQFFSLTTPDPTHPCTFYNPPKPDFRATGRRISDVKCQEYIWDIKVKAERERRASECTAIRRQELLSKPGGWRNLPHAAVGGRPALPGEFPHMGAIGWKAVKGEWDFKCGGSLISPKFVLTAAHCSKASSIDTTIVDPVPMIVRINQNNILHAFPNQHFPAYDFKIINIIVHPSYKSPKKYNDIALMELEHEIGFTNAVQPACLWSNIDISKLGSIATLTGWGVLQQGSLDISPDLQAAVVDVIDSDTCDNLLRSSCNRNWCGLQEHQLCAGKLAGGVDACQGDSGGPLQVKIPLNVDTPYNLYYVMGVTSFGIGCAQPNYPGIYTRVSSFIDWIESIVWPQ